VAGGRCESERTDGFPKPALHTAPIQARQAYGARRILIRAGGVIFSAPTGRRHVRTRNDRNASKDPLIRGAVKACVKTLVGLES
jgi:hypothetical protein